MIVSLAWTSMLDRKPSPLDIGKVFEIAYHSSAGGPKPFKWRFVKWSGAKFTGIGETPDDPRVNDGVAHESLNYPDNYWRPAA